ncbi:MAG: hypothetical protein ACWA5Q_08300 [bacterium]
MLRISHILINPLRSGVVLLAVTCVLLSNKVHAESSAEAILAGLERGASRDVHVVTPTTDRFSFRCEHKSLVREINVENPTSVPGLKCRVRYQSEKGLSYPWNARSQAEYCELKALTLRDKLQQLGWHCNAIE